MSIISQLKILAPLLLMAYITIIPIIWVFDTSPPFVYNDIKISTDDNNINVFVDGHRIRNCPVNVKILLYSPAGVRYELHTEKIDYPGPIGKTTFSSKFEKPNGMEIGVHKYESILSYVCNPMQKYKPLVIKKEVYFHNY